MPRIMALDVGEATIGVAISDELCLTAQPVVTLERRALRKDLHALKELATRHVVGSVVVGLPLQLDGKPGPAAQAVARFVDRLEKAIGIPVNTWDERLTTVQAERALLEGDVSRGDRRRVINQIAAAIILQSYLDSRTDVI